MFSKFTRISSLILALIMVFSLAACGKNGGGNAGGSSNSGKTDISKLAGTTVRFATWKDPDLNEDGEVIKKFEKETGINVQIDLVSQQEYSSVITGKIASGDAPDVYFSNGDFPTCLSCLQPLTAAKLDYEDDIWDQSTFKMSTFKDEPYLCNTMGNIWNEVDLLFYNKALLSQANCPTPEELDKNGKWTWETLEQIMTKVKALKNCEGGSISAEIMLASTGNSIFKINNGTFESGLNDSYVSVARKIADWQQKGLINGDRASFISGKVGIIVTNAFGLKRTGYFADMDWNNIGFYKLPDFDGSTKANDTGIFRGWGICRGAKNPEGAGVFLRYYLDVNNYSISDAFINSDAESFFFTLTIGDQASKTPYFTYIQFIDSISGVDSKEIYAVTDTTLPDQMAAKIESFKNNVAAGATKVNEFVEKNTGVK